MRARLLLGTIFTLAVSATVAAQPQITVNGANPPAIVTTPAGSMLGIAITGSPGNTTDWIGLYPAAASDTAYLDWKYLSGTTSPPAAGLTVANFQELLPVSPGDYEVRLFAANSFQRLAVSTSIRVSASNAAIALNGGSPGGAATVAAAAAVSVVVTDGPANATDWIGLYQVGAGNTSYLDWRYLNGTVSPPTSGSANASLTLTAPIEVGQYEYRLFVAGGYEPLAHSGILTVAATSARLTVNGVTPPETVAAEAGTSAIVELSNGPAHASDWIGLFAVGASNAQY